MFQSNKITLYVTFFIMFRLVLVTLCNFWRLVDDTGLEMALVYLKGLEIAELVMFNGEKI